MAYSLPMSRSLCLFSLEPVRPRTLIVRLLRPSNPAQLAQTQVLPMRGTCWDLPHEVCGGLKYVTTIDNLPVSISNFYQVLRHEFWSSVTSVLKLEDNCFTAGFTKARIQFCPLGPFNFFREEISHLLLEGNSPVDSAQGLGGEHMRMEWGECLIFNCPLITLLLLYVSLLSFTVLSISEPEAKLVLSCPYPQCPSMISACFCSDTTAILFLPSKLLRLPVYWWFFSCSLYYCGFICVKKKNPF